MSVTGSDRSRWIARLVKADQFDDLAYGVVATNGFGRILVAIAESVRDREHPDLAESTLVALDSWQNLGAGSLLTHHVANRAVETGIRRWQAVMLSESRPMERILHRIGPRLESRIETGLLTVTHELAVHRVM